MTSTITIHPLTSMPAKHTRSWHAVMAASLAHDLPDQPTPGPVRGVTERYYAMAARAIVLPDPGGGGPDVLMRHAVADEYRESDPSLPDASLIFAPREQAEGGAK